MPVQSSIKWKIHKKEKNPQKREKSTKKNEIHKKERNPQNRGKRGHIGSSSNCMDKSKFHVFAGNIEI